MLISTKAIVLSAVKYQDKALIAKCFTREEGLQSYFIPNAFSTKKSNQKIAYFQPLTLLQIVAQHKKKGSLEYIKEMQISHLYHSIHTSIVKSSIVLFLSEVVSQCIKEETSNKELFDFLESAFIWFDDAQETVNFHLIFLSKLTQFLGFFPDLNNSNAIYFDKLEGVFTNHFSANTLDSNESLLIKNLFELNFQSNEIKISNSQRHYLLTLLMDFYALHIDGFKKPKSLEVLSAVFN